MELSTALTDTSISAYWVMTQYILVDIFADFRFKSTASIYRVKWFSKKRGKSVPLQAWSAPEGSRKLRFPDYVTMAQNGGKVVGLMYRSFLPPREILLVLISVRG